MRLNTNTLKNAAMIALLLTVGISTGWSATREENIAKGEEMLRQARIDINEANRAAEVAANAEITAQRDQVIANQKRLQAHNLEREALLLIQDPNRMEAAVLRARAETLALQVKSERAELERLQGTLANEKQVAADTTSAAGKLRAAANAAGTPADKAALTKMAESLTAQTATANNEVASLQQRMAPIQAEINRLTTIITELNQTAQRLAPGGI